MTADIKCVFRKKKLCKAFNGRRIDSKKWKSANERHFDLRLGHTHTMANIQYFFAVLSSFCSRNSSERRKKKKSMKKSRKHSVMPDPISNSQSKSDLHNLIKCRHRRGKMSTNDRETSRQTHSKTKRTLNSITCTAFALWFRAGGRWKDSSRYALVRLRQRKAYPKSTLSRIKL